MDNPYLFNENHAATYCPEDDKLRLYVGRVPREEYLALKAEGWTSTPKQGCDFVAIWTPNREDTALSYAGEIDDEDTPPTERAADRAERFAGYRDKRLDEATGHADRYDAGPSAHGYQSKARAVRAADRHDRIATRALTQWDKADYWTHRTAGVISNALHLSSPGVRMGRIKTLEAELRKLEKDGREWATTQQAAFDSLQSVIEHADGRREKVAVASGVDFRWTLGNLHTGDGPPDAETIRRAAVASVLSGYHMGKAARALGDEAGRGARPAHEIAAEWLEGRTRPEDWSADACRSARHCMLRLAYERQMLEAQGGRAASLEMVKGGTLGGRVIAKVNKSTTSGRVVSVAVIGCRVEGWAYQVANEPGTDYALYTIKTERLAPGSYTEPTPESLAKLAEFEAAKKAANAKAPKAPPLVNPTLADAERLQGLMNTIGMRCEWNRRNGTKVSSILKMTQSEYSAASSGSYSRYETTEICAVGENPVRGNLWTSKGKAHNKAIGPVLCRIRTAPGDTYGPRRVIHITDKPSKPLPATVWQAYTAPETAAVNV